MCYRDRTFCKFTDCKKFNKCLRALTDKDKELAEKIKLPICTFANRKELECYETSKV